MQNIEINDVNGCHGKVHGLEAVNESYVDNDGSIIYL